MWRIQQQIKTTKYKSKKSTDKINKKSLQVTCKLDFYWSPLTGSNRGPSD